LHSPDVWDAGWAAVAPSLLAATPVLGGELGPPQGPPPGGLGLACAAGLALQPRRAGSLAAPLGAALPSPWLPGCNLPALLHGWAQRQPLTQRCQWPGHLPAPGGCVPVRAAPPTVCSSAQPGGWPASTARCKGLEECSAGVMGSRAPVGKLVGSSDKCHGM